MSTMDGDALRRRPAHAATVLARGLGEELALLDTRDEQYYSLDEVGAFIWQLIDGQRSIADLAAAVAAEYEAPEPTIQQDTLEIVEHLATEGLVVWQDG